MTFGLVALTGCSNPSLPTAPPSSSSTPPIPPTELASLFLTPEEIRAVTGIAIHGDPVIEGQPENRGGQLSYPCVQMIAGPSDKAVVGEGYLGYRKTSILGLSTDPRVSQTMILYPKTEDAKTVLDRLNTKLNECRKTPGTEANIGSIDSTPTQLQWTNGLGTGSRPDTCGVVVRRAENVIIGVESCRAGNNLQNSSKLVDRIYRKIYAT